MSGCKIKSDMDIVSDFYDYQHLKGTLFDSYVLNKLKFIRPILDE